MSTVQSFSKVGIWVSGLGFDIIFLVFTMLLYFYNCTLNVTWELQKSLAVNSNVVVI